MVLFTLYHKFCYIITKIVPTNALKNLPSKVTKNYKVSKKEQKKLFKKRTKT